MSTPDSSSTTKHASKTPSVASRSDAQAEPAGPTAPLARAIVVTRNLPPLVGGMERLVWHIVAELRAEYRVHVIGPAGCRPHLPDGVTASEVPIHPMLGYILGTKLATFWQALRLRPKLVVAGSGLTAPFAWLAARLTGARCVVYLHGLDIEARHPVYRTLWLPFFRHCDRVLVNSRFTRQLARSAGIPEARIAILNPGVALPDLHNAPEQSASFRRAHGLGEHPVILYVGRLTARKGLALFVQNILPQIITARPDARLVVIGDEPSHALHHRSGEKQRVTDAMASLNLGNRVLFLRNIDDQVLDAAYFAADVLVFPVQERPHDHEGFGMVAVEAAAHGLPTVAFASGGVADAVRDGVTGRLIAAGDTRAFAAAVVELIEQLEPSRRRAACRAFAKQFTWPSFGAMLRLLCVSGTDDSQGVK